jgi:anti-sigma factor RsiW
MQHLDEGTIHSWLDGALSVDEAARVQAHVKECPRCAAAVAEARGFIAASSRILTALDNVPKGVVPLAPRAKTQNWAVWRAAAAVVVVALGSFVVLRDRIATKEVSTFTASSPSRGAAPGTGNVISDGVSSDAVPTAALDKPSTSVPTTSPTASYQAAPKTENQGAVRRTAVRPPTAVAPQRQGAEVDLAREDVRENAATSQAAGAVTGSAPTFAPLRIRGVTMMDAAAGQPPVRVVRTERVIGEKRTLYEVAPGDTVILAEVLQVQLGEVVVTGANQRLAQPMRRAAPVEGRAAAAAVAKAAAPPDTQRGKESLPSAPPVSLPAPSPSVATLSGVTTLTWTDSVTRNTMKLSGRHSLGELLEIKRRIDQARAAAAGAPKKEP